MKTKLTKTFLFFFSVILFTSCNIGMMNGIQGNKNVITKKRKNNQDFTAIKVSTGLDLYITQGDSNEIKVEADENLHDIIITEVENGTLKIYTDKGIWNSRASKIHVTIKDLRKLSATSGSDVYSRNTITATDFSVRATSGADVKIKVVATNVDSNATSGADIDISGKSENHTIRATSGASIEAFGLRSVNVTAAATSGADINAYASKNINASATSAADIDFKGNPKNVRKNSSSGGSVSRY